MKVQISIDDDLLRRIDDYASDNYTTRSGVVALGCLQLLNAADMQRYVKEIAFFMRKIADKGEIDEATQRELEDFARLSSMISGFDLHAFEIDPKTGKKKP